MNTKKENPHLDRLVFLRKQAGLTQDDIAAKLKMNRASYSLIESGKIKLSDFHLRILKKEFGFDTNFILNGDAIENMGKSTTAKHTKTNEAYWGRDGVLGKKGENILVDYIDAILITNLQLILKTKKCQT